MKYLKNNNFLYFEIMEEQTALFSKPFNGNPRYSLNAPFYNLGLIFEIVEYKLCDSDGYGYRYKIGKSFINELLLIHFEISNKHIEFESLNDDLKRVYSLNFS